jgi:hypothetical protein
VYFLNVSWGFYRGFWCKFVNLFLGINKIVSEIMLIESHLSLRLEFFFPPVGVVISED